MTIGTVCSGIGAPEVAFGREGFEPIWHSEIEKFPSAVLEHHYPDVPNLGDFTTDEAIEYMVSNPPDVFVGGTPCQSFSVAGKRGSLGDDRGNLTLVFTEVWHRLRTVGTRYAVWENVPGVLNTKDNAFGCFISAMVGADTVIQPTGGKWQSAGLADGPSGCIAWRTIDAQFWGVPQRRRRIFAIVGHPGDFSVAKILFEPEGLRWNTQASRETGQEIARAVGEGTGAAGFNFEMWSGECIEASPALQARRAKDNLVYENHPNDSRVKGPLNVCEQLTARNGTGGGNLPLVQEVGQQRTDGALLATDYKGLGHNRDDKIVIEPIPIHDQATRHSGKRGSNVAYNVTFCDANGKRSDRPNGGLYVNETDQSNTLTKAQSSTLVGTYPIDTRNATRDPDKHDAINRQGIGVGNDGDPSATVTSAHVNGVASGMQVRRLTPVECERLQNFPDNWTRIPWRGKSPEQCPDGPRYKAIGNSMAVCVVEFIAERIGEQL